MSFTRVSLNLTFYSAAIRCIRLHCGSAGWLAGVQLLYICSIATLSIQHTTCHRRMDATTKTWIWIKGFCCVFFSHHLPKNKHKAMKNAAFSYLYTHELLLWQNTPTSLLGIVVAILNVVVFNLVFYFYTHKTVYRSLFKLIDTRAIFH